MPSHLADGVKGSQSPETAAVGTGVGASVCVGVAVGASVSVGASVGASVWMQMAACRCGVGLAK